MPRSFDQDYHHLERHGSVKTSIMGLPTSPVGVAFLAGKVLNCLRKGQCPVCQTKMFGMKIPQESCVVCGGTGTTDGIKQTSGLALDNVNEFIDWAQGKVQEMQQRGNQTAQGEFGSDQATPSTPSFEEEFGHLLD